MADEEVEKKLAAALAALKQETRKSHGRMALTIAGWISALILVVAGTKWLAAGKPEGLLALLCSLLCILPLVLTAHARKSQVLDALLAIQDVRAVGPLLDLLPGAFNGRRTLILSGLTRLLPELQDQDAGRLRPAHRAQLRSALAEGDFWEEHDFLVSILQALQQIGDREDLIVVKRLAIGQSDSWQERQVREAARACLPHLQERVEQLKHRDILLRPASAVAPEELLHPAIGGSDTDPTQLLRPDIQE